MMKIFSKIWISLFCLLLSAGVVRLSAQNLDNVSFDKGLKLSGGLNMSNVFYHSNIEGRRDPYSLVLSANLNLNLWGYDMPFSFTWSNAGGNYTQPFNRLSFTPQYKWIRAYIGYTSMTFSPYTLAGHSFLGGGVELSPGAWRFAVMAGRLNKAIAYDPDNHPEAEPAFRRMGYAIKLGYEKGANALSMVVFTARDDVRSIPALFPQGSQVRPQSNIAASLSGRTTLWQAITLNAEYSLSLLNSDIRAGSVAADSIGHSTSAPGLLTETATTQLFSAIQAGIGYSADHWGLQLRYERVAPGYTTLGAYYFNNDMENYTIAPNLNLLEGRLTLSANVGLQRNNLDASREATTTRLAGSANVNYSSGERLNMSASYSNFSSYTRHRPSPDPFTTNPMDSLDFYQLSNSVTASMSYSLGGKEKIRNLSFSGNYQKMNNQSEREGGGELSDFISATAGYTHGLTADMTLTAGLNANYNTAAQMKTLFWGPSLSAAASFLEKTLRAVLNLTYNQSYTNSQSDAPLLGTAINASWSPPADKKPSHHSLTFNAAYTHRFSSSTRPSQSELTVTLGYGYRF